jgi:uncharacterized membrane protein
MSSRRCREAARDRGQAVVEFALTLPLVVLTICLVVEVGAITIDQIRLVHLCRDATRAASVSADPVSVAREAVATSDADDTEVVVTIEDDVVTVSLSRIHRPEVPLIGALLPDVTLNEQLSMHTE